VKTAQIDRSDHLVPIITIKHTIMRAIDYLSQCSVTFDHLPAFLSRFLVRLVRHRLPDMPFDLSGALDTFMADPQNGGQQQQQDHHHPHPAFRNTTPTSQPDLSSSMTTTLASLQNGHKHHVPGMDKWLDLGLFDFLES
jgi:hypothetical protein